VDASFVALNEVEGGAFGELGVGGDDGGEGGGSVAGRGDVDHAGFDGPTASLPPGGGGQLLDHGELDGIGGAQDGDVVVGERLEGLVVLGLEDDDAGEESMFEGVRGGTGFSRGRDGSTGASRESGLRTGAAVSRSKYGAKIVPIRMTRRRRKRTEMVVLRFRTLFFGE
jgi:hypothetical protein